MRSTDFRGSAGDSQPCPGRTYVEWETTPARSAQTTVFTWIGGTQIRPAMRPAFPHVAATLTIDGKHVLKFPFVCPDRGRSRNC